MCGIVGIKSDKENVCLSIYNALTVLQHRGQDAAGMAVSDSNGFLKMHKDNGLVRMYLMKSKCIDYRVLLV